MHFSPMDAPSDIYGDVSDVQRPLLHRMNQATMHGSVFKSLATLLNWATSQLPAIAAESGSEYTIGTQLTEDDTKQFDFDVASAAQQAKANAEEDEYRARKAVYGDRLTDEQLLSPHFHQDRLDSAVRNSQAKADLQALLDDAVAKLEVANAAVLDLTNANAQLAEVNSKLSDDLFNALTKEAPVDVQPQEQSAAPAAEGESPDAQPAEAQVKTSRKSKAAAAE